MKRKSIIGCGVMMWLSAVLLTGCGTVQGKDASQIKQGNLALGVSVHDPSVVK